jgi:acyl-CoA dehydrogenase
MTTDHILDGLIDTDPPSSDLAKIAWEIGVDVAGPAAADVDARARFPQETRDALAQTRLLSAMVPVDQGGLGASLAEVSGAIRALASHCTSSALVLAMHSNEVAQLVNFADRPGLRALTEELCERQLLIANANSETGVGGDATRSLCFLEETDAGLRLRKSALACSYGEYADLISATARRSEDAEESDQSVALMRAEDIQITRTRDWDTTGLRGTCSTAIDIDARVDPDLVFTTPFATMAEGGTLVRSMIMLSSVWVGLSEAAVATAHRQVRAAARRSIGTVPPSALRLAEVATELASARGALASILVDYARAEASGHLAATQLLVGVRTLKVLTSRLLVQIAGECLGIVGIAGYARSGPASMDRILRDANGSVLMVNNDRYLGVNARAFTLLKEL